MHHYTFALRHDDGVTGDETGIWSDDRERACRYAHDVADELMRGREEETRSWRLDVYEDGKRVDELLFARIDPTLADLAPRLRATVQQGAEYKRAFRDALSDVRSTLRESKALVARSRGKPYLATLRGEPTIKTNEPTINTNKSTPDRDNRRRGSGNEGDKRE